MYSYFSIIPVLQLMLYFCVGNLFSGYKETNIPLQYTPSPIATTSWFYKYHTWKISTYCWTKSCISSTKNTTFVVANKKYNQHASITASPTARQKSVQKSSAKMYEFGEWHRPSQRLHFQRWWDVCSPPTSNSPLLCHHCLRQRRTTRNGPTYTWS